MMLPRNKFGLIFYFIFGFSFLIILSRLWYTIKTCHCPVEEIADINMKLTQEDLTQSSQSLPGSEEILNTTRSKIRSDLLNYSILPSNVKADDLAIESGGTPLRYLIVSSWRSGSTFLGDIFNSIPGTFYHFEPFLPLQTKQIKGPLSDKALNVIKKLFKCNFENMNDYIEYEYVKHGYKVFNMNRRLWDHCMYNGKLCRDADFVSKFCRLFPIQTMKLVRLRLKYILEMMEDEEFNNMKVVLLTRDPRGVMQSRRHILLCQSSPDCFDPKALCADMVSDHLASTQFLLKYPNRFMAIRYEDLALNLKSTTHRIMKFLNQLPAMPFVEQYLQYHTNITLPGMVSTFRVSHDVPFKWKKILDFEEVKKIQNDCTDAMASWGYEIALNATHMASDSFKPFQEYIFT